MVRSRMRSKELSRCHHFYFRACVEWAIGESELILVTGMDNWELSQLLGTGRIIRDLRMQRLIQILLNVCVGALTSARPSVRHARPVA